MNPIGLFDPSMNLLGKALDLRAANERIISSNIANAETPGYTPARFEFEQELRQAVSRTASPLATTQPAHIPTGNAGLESVTGTVIKTPDKTGIGDKNGVKVDQEMIALSKNELMYESAAQILQKKITLLGYVIQGGQ
ncbi:MAG: flagellar basal body rod protein FlgB [Desulfocapsaceae bacterium]|nr:flagellar basal body rod protein FlgB [Desulfocapsaceae bacterium]